MDRDSRMEKIKSISTAVFLALLFVIITVGLVVLGFRSGSGIVHYTLLRSEFAKRVSNLEDVNCKVTWRPDDAYEAVALEETPNPTKLSFTFAMSKGAKKMYLDRYVQGNGYITLLLDGDKGYSWSAMEELGKRGELYSYEYKVEGAPSYYMDAETFQYYYKDLLLRVDKMIREVSAGAEIVCTDGGASSYSAPSNTDGWLEAIKSGDGNDFKTFNLDDITE